MVRYGHLWQAGLKVNALHCNAHESRGMALIAGSSLTRVLNLYAFPGAKHAAKPAREVTFDAEKTIWHLITEGIDDFVARTV